MEGQSFGREVHHTYTQEREEIAHGVELDLSTGVGMMHFCEQSVDGEYYRRVLREEIPLNGLLTPTPFIYDGAPAQSTELTKQCLVKLDLVDFCHPPQSPDLNPIENIWTIMKAELRKAPATSLNDLRVKQKSFLQVSMMR
ncbi:hypothetical protein PybrP1_009467 [[Pythium] brassicae (nom. inval.)]|nr:hypothetical protein PybrP1_009467 [[Pythium] brassicae (nom. inval.)]